MGALRGLDWAEGRRRAAIFMAELGLECVIDEKIRKMSKGMAQMVQLIGSIIHAPDLIVLDEPFSGLDPVNQERLEMLVRRSEEHTSELQSLMRISYAVFCLKKKTKKTTHKNL